MILVKICGVTREEDAYEAAIAGADYIGLIFSQRSPRNIDELQGLLIAEAARKGGAKPVAVFTDTPKNEMERIAEDLNLDTIQLHSDYAIDQGKELKYHLIFVNPKTYNGIGNQKDYILFDSKDGRFGPLFLEKKERWFLAGGLNPKNVQEAIQKHRPPGVDVASGVEKGAGIKDLKLVKDFIRLAKNG